MKNLQLISLEKKFHEGPIENWRKKIVVFYIFRPLLAQLLSSEER